MNRCLTCNEPIEQKKGHRKRFYCNSTCRLRYWQKNNKRPIRQQKTQTEVKSESLSLQEQLRMLETEKCPVHIQSEQMKVLWQQAQRKKINELRRKLIK